MPDADTAPLQVNTGSTDFAALGNELMASYGLSDATPAPADAPKADDEVKESPPETPAAEASKDNAAKAPEGDKAPKTDDPPAPKDGTHDKALQKLQQQFSSIESRFDALMAKIEKAGGSATPEQLAALQKLQTEQQAAKSKIETIAAKSPDEIDTADVQTIAGEVSASEKEMRDTIKELRAGRDADRKEFADLKAEITWQVQETRFPGINVRDIWDKAKQDAAKEVESEIEGLELAPAVATKLAYKRANTLYEKRVEEASKSKDAKSAPETRSSRPAAAAPVTEPIAPAGSAKVSSDLRSAAPERTENPHASPSREDYRKLGESILGRM